MLSASSIILSAALLTQGDTFGNKIAILMSGLVRIPPNDMHSMSSCILKFVVDL